MAVNISGTVAEIAGLLDTAGVRCARWPVEAPAPPCAVIAQVSGELGTMSGAWNVTISIDLIVQAVTPRSGRDTLDGLIGTVMDALAAHDRTVGLAFGAPVAAGDEALMVVPVTVQVLV